MMEESTSSLPSTGSPPPFILEGEPFFALKKVETYTATAKKDSQEYIKVNALRKIPRITQLKGFMEVKGRDKPILMVGGGPSLKRPEVLSELKEMAKTCPVFVTGSSHDYIISQGIIPNCAAVVDPDPVTVNYFTNPQKSTVYLIASQCHPSVFDHLQNYKVALWHCFSKEDEDTLMEVEPNFFGVGGGCTVGMRGLSIAIMFGYSNIHLFGYDSCLGVDGTDHAYPLSTEAEMLGLTGVSGKLYPVKLGIDTPQSKTYTCMGYQLAQLWHFHDYYKLHYNYFTPTVHGGGPLAELADIVKEEVRLGLENGSYAAVNYEQLRDMDAPGK